MNKHVAKITNTDQRVVVVFRQIPDKPDHALVVSIDNLHPRFEQAIMEVIETKEAQAETVLAKVLGRRIMPDTNENVLKALHDRNLLEAVHVDRVVMLPQPHMPIPLREVIQKTGGQPIPGDAPAAGSQERFNPHAVNAAALTEETKQMIARNLLIEADMLAREADNKREKAYAYLPALRPAALTGSNLSIRTDGNLTITSDKVTASKPKKTTTRTKPKTGAVKETGV